MFQRCQTGGSTFSHSGSSDSHEAPTDGGKNKQLRLNFVSVLLQPECLFPPLSYLFLLHAPPQSSAPCFVTSMYGSTVSPIVCWETFHPVSPANLDLQDNVCLCVSDCGRSIVFIFQCLQVCLLSHTNLSKLHHCLTLPAMSGTFFPCTFFASVFLCLKCCLFYLADRFVHGRTAKNLMFFQLKWDFLNAPSFTTVCGTPEGHQLWCVA